MRIATWNLARCRPGSSARAVRLAELMAEIAADVWVLTETHRDFLPGPAYRLAAHSADASDRVGGRGECWVAIWSRLPAERVTLSGDLERVAAARVGGSVVVVGTVLPWLTDDRHPQLHGSAAFLARLAEQAADWQRLRAVAQCGLCVAGDFNQDLLPVGHYYGSAEGRRALKNALAAAELECLTGGADDPLAGTPGLACIDHICVCGLRPRGQPHSSAWPAPGTLPPGLTDHYGVWVDLLP
jgi:endonuclease/exonuclease/phosphatase family metal-dependent hydrolase